MNGEGRVLPAIATELAERMKLAGLAAMVRAALKELGFDMASLVSALWLVLDEVPLREWTEEQKDSIARLSELLQLGDGRNQ